MKLIVSWIVMIVFLHIDPPHISRTTTPAILRPGPCTTDLLLENGRNVASHVCEVLFGSFRLGR